MPSNSQRIRRSFKSKTAAEAYAAEKRRERDETGFSSVALNQVQRTEWSHCQNLAKANGQSVIELVQLGIQAKARQLPAPSPAPSPATVTSSPVPPSPTTKTIAEVIEEYAAHLRWKNRNKRTHDNAHARITRGVLRKALQAKLETGIHLITLHDLRDAISPASARSTHKVQWAVQALFAFAADSGRRWVTDNVALGLGKATKPTAEDDDDEPAILATWEVKALLYTAQAQQEFHELIPCLAVQLFGSSRLSEARRMPPLELDLSFAEIKFGAKVAKREARRSVDYESACTRRRLW